METSDTPYNTNWFVLGEFTLKLAGLNLDAVYANLARHIAGKRLGTGGDIAEAVERDK
jgi:hypothetical protein